MAPASKEQWKPVVGYEGHYEVSNRGRVRGLRYSHGVRPHPRLMKPQWNIRIRALYAPLWKAGKEKRIKVAVLVLQTFVGPRPEGLVCCHYDDNGQNNQVENLRWDTQKANKADARRNGGVVFGERHGAAKLTWKKVKMAKRLRIQGVSYEEIGRRFRVTGAAISNAVRGKTWNSI